MEFAKGDERSDESKESWFRAFCSLILFHVNRSPWKFQIAIQAAVDFNYELRFCSFILGKLAKCGNGKSWPTCAIHKLCHAWGQAWQNKWAAPQRFQLNKNLVKCENDIVDERSLNGTFKRQWVVSTATKLCNWKSSPLGVPVEKILLSIASQWNMWCSWIILEFEEKRNSCRQPELKGNWKGWK